MNKQIFRSRKDRHRYSAGNMIIIPPNTRLDCLSESIECADSTEDCGNCMDLSLRDGELFDLAGGIEIIEQE